MEENVYDLESDKLTTENDGDSQEQIDTKAKIAALNNPDIATVERLRNLGIVGTALKERANDNSFQTDYLLAKEALNKFMEGVEHLGLDPVSEKGMRDLVTYLGVKIDKRLKSNIEMTALE